MVAAIEDITINEGIDPRESFLLSGGGATPAHLGEIAVILGVRRFLVPRLSSALSAFGGLVAEVRFDEMETLLVRADHADVPRINAVPGRLKQRSALFLQRAGVPAGQQGFSYAVLGRYQFQSWEIEVPFEAADGVLDAAAIAELVRGFHRTHERIYSIKDEADRVEFVTWKVSGHGKPPAARWPRRGTDAVPAAPVPHERRPVYEPGRRALFDTAVFRGDTLASGAQIAGPAVVEQETTTLYVPASGHLTVTGAGDYLVEILH
jgi:N-methylhydantoinase A